MADNIPVAEFFARMGLDASDFINEVRGAREKAIQEFKATAKAAEDFTSQLERILASGKFTGTGASGIGAAATKGFEKLEKSGANLDEILKVMTNDYFRFEAGLNDSVGTINRLSSALKQLGASDLETRFARMRHEFKEVQAAFEGGLISQRTFDQAKHRLDALAQQVKNFQAGKGSGFPKEDEAAIARAARSVADIAKQRVKEAEQTALARQRHEENYTKWWFGEVVKKEQAEAKAAQKSIAEKQREVDAKKKADQDYTVWWLGELIRREKAEKTAAAKARTDIGKRADATTTFNFQEELRQYEAKKKLDDDNLRRKQQAVQEETRLERMMGQARREMDADFLQRSKEKAKTFEKFGQTLYTVGQGLQNFGNMMTYSVTLPLVGAAVSIIKVTSNLESMRAALTRTSGSRQRADEIIVGLRDFVNKAPLGIDNVAKMTRRIQELRISTRPATEVLRTLGDAVFALGGGEPEIERVIKAFGDIAAAGKLAGQEVRQLVNANIPAIQLLAAELGKTPAQIKSMMREGALDAETTIEALMKGLNKRFAGEMNNRMNTIAGEWERLKNMLVFTMQDLGTSQLPLIKELLKTAQAFLKVTEEAARSFATLDVSTQKLMLGATAAVALGGPLAKMVGFWASGWGKVITGIKDVVFWVGKKGVPGTLIGALMGLPGAAQVGLGFGIAAAAGLAIKALIDVNKEVDKTQYKLDAIDRKYRGKGAAPEVSFGERAIATTDILEAQRDIFMQGIGPKIGVPDFLLNRTIAKKEIDPEEAEKAAAKFKRSMELLGLKDNTEDLRKFKAAWNDVMPTLKDDLSIQIAENSLISLLNKMLASGVITLKQYVAELTRMVKLPSRGFTGRQVIWDEDLIKAEEASTRYVNELNNISNEQRVTAETQQIFNLQLRDYSAELEKAVTAGFAFQTSLDKMNNSMLTGRKGQDKKLAALYFSPEVAKLDIALDALGVKDRNADLATMAVHLRTVSAAFAQGLVSSRTYALSWEKYYKAKLDSEGKLLDFEERHYEQIRKQLGAASRLQQYWKGVSSQISTILTDLSRSAIEILFPKGGEDKSPFNSNITGGLESGFQKISSAGYSNPRAALEQTLMSIKNATTLIEANRIAIKAFGDVGPQIAAGLRDGSISGDKLAGVLDKISSSLDTANEKGSKFSQLMGEVRTAILRAFAEEGAKAVADFVGKHLRRLISNLDEILTKIPIIGKGLEKIFGLGGKKSAGSGPLGDIYSWPEVSMPGTTPPTIPGYPSGSPPPTVPGGGGAGSGVSSLVGNINMISGIVSAAAGIGTIWVLMKIEGSINQVERNTAAMSIHQRHTLEKLNAYIPELSSIRGYLWDAFHPGFVELLSRGGGSGGGDTFNIYINGDRVEAADQAAVQMLTDGAKELRRRGYRGTKA